MKFTIHTAADGSLTLQDDRYNVLGHRMSVQDLMCLQKVISEAILEKINKAVLRPLEPYNEIDF